MEFDNGDMYCWKAQKRNGFVRLVLCYFDYLFVVVLDCEMMNGLRADGSLLTCFSKSLLQLLQKSIPQLGCLVCNPTTNLGTQLLRDFGDELT